MKFRAVLFIFIIALGSIFIAYKKSLPRAEQSTAQTISPTIALFPPDSEVTLQDHDFLIYWQMINPKGLILIPNFLEKKTSALLKEDNTCLYGVNGGFYTPEHTPIGLFVSNHTLLSKASINQTLNGFFVKNIDGSLALTRNQPNSDSAFALQSGPYIVPGVALNIKKDSFDRRVLIARTDSDAWYFIAITDKENSFSGPKLLHIPTIVQSLPIGVSEALNLDGGSASAFYNDKGVRLGELTAIGSFFCGKNH